MRVALLKLLRSVENGLTGFLKFFARATRKEHLVACNELHEKILRLEPKMQIASKLA